MGPPLTPLPAATVLFLRDSPDGGPSPLEVLMLRRNDHSAFVGGAYLFPGGAVDDEDADPALWARCRGRADAEASAVLGFPRGGLAFWVAGLRESFEEAGLLLGEPALPAERQAQLRADLEAGRLSFAEVCEQADLTLHAGEMHAFSHWVTPQGAPRRYDTRFFVAQAPEGQVPSPDLTETVAHLWIRPEEALARNEAGGFELIFPTLRSLVALSGFATAAEVLAAARAAEPDGATHAGPGRIAWVADHDGWRIPLPGDAAASPPPLSDQEAFL